MAATGLSSQQMRTAVPSTVDGTAAVSDEGDSLAAAKANHTHATLYTPAGGVARTFAAKLADVLSVRDFGAAGDGVTDDTAAFVLAMAAAGATGRPAEVLVPSGTYLLTPGADSMTGAIVIPDNVTLRGEGYGSVLQVNVSVINHDARYRLFGFGSHVRVRELRLDGNKAAVSTGGLTSVGFDGFIPSVNTGVTDVAFEHLWVHDIYALARESFGVLFAHASGAATGAVTKVAYRHCRGWNCLGTPFHVDGFIDATNIATWDTTGYLLDGAEVLDVWAWSNTWQGFSVFAAKNVQVANCRFWGNTLNGLNAEWCRNVTVHGVVSFGNARGGLGTSGKADVKLFGCHLFGNNTAASAVRGEVSLTPGSWYAGTARANAGTVELIGCKLEPAAGYLHIAYSDDQTVTVGSSMPDRLIVACAGAAAWLVGTGNSSPYHKLACQEFHGLTVVGRSVLTRPAEWTASSGSLTIAAASTGTTGTGPAAFTTSTQNESAYSLATLQPGRTYRVRARIRPDDTVAKWTLLAQLPSSGAVQRSIAEVQATAANVSTWVTTEGIVTVPSTATGPWRVQMARSTATGSSSTISVDWVDAEEVSEQSSPANGMESLAGRVVGAGAAAPTSGSYAIGDMWLNTAPATGGNFGWVCTAAGTPGTWKQFGLVATAIGSPVLAAATIDGAAASNRQISFTTSNVNRWIARANTTAEGGGNAGSDFEFSARDDTGASIGTALVLIRSTRETQVPVQLKIGGGTAIKKHISGSTTWDPASVAAGAQTTTTVTVTGAAVGDTVAVGFSQDLQGMQLTGYVSATSTVTVVLRNGTAGAIDLASGTLRADAWQH